uniref:Pre-mRNA processing factor 39 n=1 Tax=Sinocyclocheilus grahami TaxID=75366 RepID=A0A672MNZ1_SINGR
RGRLRHRPDRDRLDGSSGESGKPRVRPAGAGDSESPTNMELEDAPKETAEAEEPATDTAATHESELPADYERLFKVVEDNPEDFNGWVYLLQYVEQENHLVASRKAFDDFFLHYPYCYGYWKKYADIEKKHGYVHLADEVSLNDFRMKVMRIIHFCYHEVMKMCWLKVPTIFRMGKTNDNQFLLNQQNNLK